MDQDSRFVVPGVQLGAPVVAPANPADSSPHRPTVVQDAGADAARPAVATRPQQQSIVIEGDNPATPVIARPAVNRTPSSYIDNPPSPARHGFQTASFKTGTAQPVVAEQREEADRENQQAFERYEKEQEAKEEEAERQRLLSEQKTRHGHKQQEKRAQRAQVAHNSEPHVAPVTGQTNNGPVPVKPAKAADIENDRKKEDPIPTKEQSNVLPTGASIHPEVQAQALAREDPEKIGREVEKAEADRREVRGEEPKGTIVEGYEDDQLFTLLRRFDQDVTHTLVATSINPLPPSQPDLRRSVLPDVPYSTDVLKANVERVYAAGGVGLVRGVKELQRLRTWSPEERTRTKWFCITYFVAWGLGLAIPTVLAFIILLIVSPESRYVFFPPIPPPKGTPPSALDPTNQTGDLTLLGGTDSAVQHKSKAEQKEEAAWEFRNLAEAFAVKLAVSSGDKEVDKTGNAAVGPKDGTDPDAEQAIEQMDSEDDYLNDVYPDGQRPDYLSEDMYAPGENPRELAKQNLAARGLISQDELNSKTRSLGDKSTPQGLRGKTVTVRQNGKRVEKPMTESQRKKAEAKEAKAKRDQIVGDSLKMTQDVLGDLADMAEILTK